MDQVEQWFLALPSADANRVGAAIDTLADEGPTLGRPLSDRIKGSRLHNMKELRPQATSFRILFVFDPDRQAILLVAGDKAGQWQQWYTDNIPVAEARYEQWLIEREKDR
ncbi:type II toxin-antitoxin system RelE/ParE family toxin [Nocardia sp. NPDC019395]|uniref:type II toxin-antitoxin system RelE/ParE family toxin n=1 Tax=Nocardia sp. NPDC019395 TaxID=3154686 RepID=UPI0033E5A4A5